VKDLAGRVLEEDAIPGAILGFRVRVH